MRSKASVSLLQVLEAVVDRDLAESELAALLSPRVRVRQLVDALESEGLVEVALRERGPVYRATAAGRAALAARGVEVDRPGEEVAVLFSDIVASTELLSSTEPDVAHALRREHFDDLRHALAEHRGHEIKNLGDGLMATFATSAGAVACGRAMVRRTRRRGRLSVRVGVDVGTPVREVDDYFGPTVVIAKRLCDTAGSNELLVSAGVHDQLSAATARGFEARGALDLKGLPDPTTAYASDCR